MLEHAFIFLVLLFVNVLFFIYNFVYYYYYYCCLLGLIKVKKKTLNRTNTLDVSMSLDILVALRETRKKRVDHLTSSGFLLFMISFRFMCLSFSSLFFPLIHIIGVITATQQLAHMHWYARNYLIIGNFRLTWENCNLDSTLKHLFCKKNCIFWHYNRFLDKLSRHIWQWVVSVRADTCMCFPN